MRILLAMLMALLSGSAFAAGLTVTIADLDKKGGELHVALYNEALWPDDNSTPIVEMIVPAVAPETIVVMKDVPPGVYGVKCYQDANRNGKIDRNFLGIPLERYGFSRDARPVLSEPEFKRTKFTIAPGENAIVIHLQ